MIERLSNDTKVDMERLTDDEVIQGLIHFTEVGERVQVDVDRFANEALRRRVMATPECSMDEIAE